MDKFFYLIVAIAVIQIAWVVFSLVSLHRFVPNYILKKYPRSVRILCALPFPSNWHTKIADEDMYFFKKYRKILLRMDLFLLLTFVLELLLSQMLLCNRLEKLQVQEIEIHDMGIIARLMIYLCN